jgi:hypothetical protein
MFRQILVHPDDQDLQRILWNLQDLWLSHTGWEITQIFNDWFDLFNSRSKYTDKCLFKNAFGDNYNDQKEFLMNVKKTVSTMRVVNHKGLIPFQKGILLSIRSLL